MRSSSHSFTRTYDTSPVAVQQNGGSHTGLCVSWTVDDSRWVASVQPPRSMKISAYTSGAFGIGQLSVFGRPTTRLRQTRMRPRVGTNCSRRIDATFGNTMRTRVGAVRCRRRNATADATASAAKELDRKFCSSRSRLRGRASDTQLRANVSAVAMGRRGCGGRRRRGRGGYPPLLQQPRIACGSYPPHPAATTNLFAANADSGVGAHAHQPAAAATQRRGSQPARETRSLGAAVALLARAAPKPTRASSRQPSALRSRGR